MTVPTDSKSLVADARMNLSFSMSTRVTPPPSPPSSPSLCVDSSSPASSPIGCFEHLDDDAIPPISLIHPFAASAKPNWHPPEYEKKRSRSPATLQIVKKTKCDHTEKPSWRSLTKDDVSPSFTPVEAQLKKLSEEDIWDNASTRMVDEGHGAVTLNNENLTVIPESFIDDLAKFYAPPESHEILNPNAHSYSIYGGRPLNRVATVPSVSGDRSMQRTQSAAMVSFGLPRDKIQLFLSSNRISNLPLSLFSLQNLTVLSLRQNKISYIPPEIAGLERLEDLNISQNLIQYLPAEMLQMSLKSLQVHPNPFQSPKTPEAHNLSSTTSEINLRRRPISKTSHTMPSRIPPLIELLLRILLSPYHPNRSLETVLEAYYHTPLPECPKSLSDQSTPGKIYFRHSLPIHLRRILDLCLPGSVYSEDETTGDFLSPPGKAATITGVGSCPSPKHQYSETPRLFVRHAEERMSWEKMVAGVDVGGCVPLLWRGCRRGCLDFLEPPEELILPATEVVSNNEFVSMDIELQNEDIIQPIQTLGQRALDFDD